MRNLINLLHSVFASIISTNYITKPTYKTKQIIYFTSQTYFLHDLYRIRKGDYLDIIHHIISSIGLLCFYIGYYDNIIIELYHYGEILNVAIFGHYLVIKNVTDKRILLVSSSLEFVIYTYYRFLCMTQLIFDNYEIFDFCWHTKIKLYTNREPVVKFYRTYPHNPFIGYHNYK